MLGLFSPNSNSPKSASATCTTAAERDCVCSSEYHMLVKISSNESVPVTDTCNHEFNAENKTFQQPKCILSITSDCKNVCGQAGTDEDSNNMSPNCTDSLLLVGPEECDISSQSKDYEVDCNKAHSGQVSYRVEANNITSEENVQMLVPVTNSSNQEYDNSNSECFYFCKNDGIKSVSTSLIEESSTVELAPCIISSNEESTDSSTNKMSGVKSFDERKQNLNIEKTEISETDSVIDKPNTFLDTDETDLIHKKDNSDSSKRTEHPLEPYHCERKFENQTEQCFNEDINSHVKYNSTKCSASRSASIVELVPCIASSNEENTNSTTTNLSGVKSFEERKNGSHHYSEETTDVEFHHLRCTESKENKENTLMKTKLTCTKSIDYNKCSANSELCNKHHVGKNYVKSSSFKTGNDFHIVVPTKSMDTSPNHHYDGKESKRNVSHISQGVLNSSDFIPRDNTELLQSSNSNEAHSSGILFSSSAECSKDGQSSHSSLPVEDKQKETNNNNVSCCSDNCNDQCDSTSDVIPNAKFFNPNLLTDARSKTERDKMGNGNLFMSDNLNCIEAYGTDASEGAISSEISSSIENCDSPPSPEEKVIYDSQGNIMSSNTKCSQYSLCLGDHYIPQDDEVPFRNCSEVLSSNISKCNAIKGVHIDGGITYKSVLNLMKPARQPDSSNTEQSAMVDAPGGVNPERDNEYHKANAYKHFSNKHLFHNNTVETDLGIKNALPNVSLEQMPFLTCSESNAKVPTNDTSRSLSDITLMASNTSETFVDKNRLMANVHWNASDESDTCKTSDKNTLASVKFHSGKSDETKSLLHQCGKSSSTTDITKSQNNSSDADNCSSHVHSKYDMDPCGISDNNSMAESSNFSSDNPKITVTNSSEVPSDDGLSNDENVKSLNRTELSKVESADQKKTERTLFADRTKYCDILQDYKQVLEKPKEFIEDLKEENNFSDVQSTYLHTVPDMPETENSDENLNETPRLQEEKSDTYSGICSFYTTTTFSNIESTTVCNNKMVEVCTTIPMYKAVQVPFETANETISSKVFAGKLGKVYTPQKKPPSYGEIISTLDEHNIPQARHQHAFYSCCSDAPRINAEFTLPTMKITELPKFEGTYQCPGLEKWQSDLTLKNLQIDSSFSVMDAIKSDPQLKVAFAKNRSVVLQPVKFPPSRYEIEKLPSNKDCTMKQDKENTFTELKNNDIPEISFGQDEELTKLTTAKCIQEESFSPVKRINWSCHQHSTPLKKPSKRKRSSSWNGDKTDIYSPPLKHRRTSADEKSSYLVDSKTDIFFPRISPIVDKNSRKIEKTKRKFTVDSEAPESDGCDPLRPGLPIKKISSTEERCPATTKHEFLTLMSLEVHAETRQNLRPDPKHDSIKAIFYCINNDLPESSSTLKEVVGIIATDPESTVLHMSFNGSQQNSFKTGMNRSILMRSGISEDNIFIVEDELSILNKLVDITRKWNPDVLCGYEIQMLSWGYLIQRAAYLNVNLTLLLSRVPEEKCSAGDYLMTERDYHEYGSIPEIHVTGRIVLNIWRVLRKEVTLNTYTFENVAYHVLHQRVPCYSFHSLTHWFNSQVDMLRWRVINYYTIRVKGQLHLLHSLNLISRTSTLARIFGIQFYEVLSRGSQFRVESMMLRSAKPLHYVAISPSPEKRANAKAPECFALVMEPESTFYTDPVVVLDFQSLYPSMVIAYNYCYSTCLGRVACLGQDTAFEFGCALLTIPSALIKKLANNIHISPNGVVFVKHHVRMGVLPQMLHDILTTRIMVKNAMKAYKDDKDLHRLLDGRQLALKLIANVTYGYTAANFSGRMPCVEIADSIVGKARETLERAIKLVERTAKWNAKVVYGDTDSLFVLLKGRSKEQAFKIGQEIAAAVTAINPKPVKLKFEKVYLPCVLQTKKRYVGFMYETPEQQEPVFDAKGIETIRRDSCPIVAQILETSLRLLFTSKDLSLIKRYVQKQFQNILSGKTSLQDLIFAREYRGMSNYRPSACVPGLEIARRLITTDSRAEPRVGERVPYVIVYGFPGLPLIQLVRQPQELLTDASLRINAKYYIRQIVIPPLHRVFSLIGANVASWYINMPWCNDAISRTAPQERNRCTLSQYLTVRNCILCNKINDHGICIACKDNPQHVALMLSNKIRKWERKFHHLSQICQMCTGVKYKKSDCISLDCPVLFKLHQANKDMSKVSYYRQLQQSLDF